MSFAHTMQRAFPGTSIFLKHSPTVSSTFSPRSFTVSAKWRGSVTHDHCQRFVIPSSKELSHSCLCKIRTAAAIFNKKTMRACARQATSAATSDPFGDAALIENKQDCSAAEHRIRSIFFSAEDFIFPRKPDKDSAENRQNRGQFPSLLCSGVLARLLSFLKGVLQFQICLARKPPPQQWDR